MLILVLLILAAVFFGLAIFATPSKFSLVAAGLFCVTLSVLLPKLGVG